MKLIISPAKKMNRDTDTAPYRDLPMYVDRARELMDYIRSLGCARCRTIWNCSARLAELNWRRFQDMDLTRALTPAILSYEGLQYQYLAPRVLDDAALEYLQAHLRIMSGFYGILRPFDGVVPYRLEMQAKPWQEKEKPASLYEYWGDTLAEHLFREDRLILNLASKEYSRCIARYAKGREDVRFVTCVFGEKIDGRIVEKGTLAKMARGEMVRYLAEKQAEDPETVKSFCRLDYEFCEENSDSNTFVFVKKITNKTGESCRQTMQVNHVGEECR
ncbi:MAG: peroxide stress protein YaaA [Lachnospiraceae bacterium]|nr:peroxide stress protein YaaA [Lachnospiraceae bacterium]